MACFIESGAFTGGGPQNSEPVMLEMTLIRRRISTANPILPSLDPEIMQEGT